MCRAASDRRRMSLVVAPRVSDWVSNLHQVPNAANSARCCSLHLFAGRLDYNPMHQSNLPLLTYIADLGEDFNGSLELHVDVCLPSVMVQLKNPRALDSSRIFGIENKGMAVFLLEGRCQLKVHLMPGSQPVVSAAATLQVGNKLLQTLAKVSMSQCMVQPCCTGTHACCLVYSKHASALQLVRLAVKHGEAPLRDASMCAISVSGARKWSAHLSPVNGTERLICLPCYVSLFLQVAELPRHCGRG